MNVFLQKLNLKGIFVHSKILLVSGSEINVIDPLEPEELVPKFGEQICLNKLTPSLKIKVFQLKTNQAKNSIGPHFCTIDSPP